MLQYLVILLDDTSTSYCHCENPLRERKLISLEDLKSGILFAMKQNLMVQFVLPDYSLSTEYLEVMNTIDSHIFVSSLCEDKDTLKSADVVVFHDWTGLNFGNYDADKSYVLRTTKADLFDCYKFLQYSLSKVSRMNVVITDVETFNTNDFEKYKSVLSVLVDYVKAEIEKGHNVQLNLLTDRVVLENMNNCNAGDENITLAPNGKFYVCPAFYYDECKGVGVVFFGKDYSVGSLKNGLGIKNPQLYKLAYAPICRNCDAYQCKRCVWLNRKMTLEVNTPSHEQCVVAHLERNASRLIAPERIQEIDYLDPFDKRDE